MDLGEELREQGRGMAGALLVLGVSFAYTVETWRIAVDVRPLHLIGFLVAGLALVVAITRSVGFRSEGESEEGMLEADEESEEEAEKEESDGERAHGDGEIEAGDDSTGGRRGGSPLWVEVAEVVFQSFVIAYATLALLGIVDLRTPFPVVLRTGIVQVVPLAIGAALANELLGDDQQELPEVGFPKYIGLFVLGAIFFSAPIAPTGEVGLIAAQLGWVGLCVLLLVTLAVTYLVLYELEFQGQSRRLQDRSRWRQAGQTCVVYAVGLFVAFGLLVALGGIETEPPATWVRRTVVLAFPAAVGASGARVVLG